MEIQQNFKLNTRLLWRSLIMVGIACIGTIVVFYGSLPIWTDVIWGLLSISAMAMVGPSKFSHWLERTKVPDMMICISLFMGVMIMANQASSWEDFWNFISITWLPIFVFTLGLLSNPSYYLETENRMTWAGFSAMDDDYAWEHAVREGRLNAHTVLMKRGLFTSQFIRRAPGGSRWKAWKFQDTDNSSMAITAIGYDVESARQFASSILKGGSSNIIVMPIERDYAEVAHGLSAKLLAYQETEKQVREEETARQRNTEDKCVDDMQQYLLLPSAPRVECDSKYEGFLKAIGTSDCRSTTNNEDNKK
jgi:hypothetical protein